MRVLLTRVASSRRDSGESPCRRYAASALVYAKAAAGVVLVGGEERVQLLEALEREQALGRG